MYVCMYTYIYIERERDAYIYIYIYIYIGVFASPSGQTATQHVASSRGLRISAPR